MECFASVSVVIPAYNAERYLRSTLESVLAQTTRPREIITVDDGSIDGTAGIAKSFGGSVGYIHQENAGVAAARNRGIGSVTGDWVALLDADDQWMPEHLQRCMSVLENDPSLVWCCASHIRKLRNGRELDPSVGGWMTLPTTRPNSVEFFDVCQAGAPIQTSGMVIRNDVLREVGLFDVNRRRGEDRDLWFRIAMRYPRMGFVWPPTVRYVMTKSSITAQLEDATDRMLGFLTSNVDRRDLVASETRGSFERMLRRLAREILWHALNMARADALATLRHEFPQLLSPTERLLAAVGSCTPRALLGILAAAHRRIVHRTVQQSGKTITSFER